MMIGENKQFDLLYRGTRDGFAIKEFLSRVEGKGETLTIVKSKQ